MYETIRLWLQLLDYGSERGISDSAYMAIADRFTAWVGALVQGRVLSLGKELNVMLAADSGDKR